MVKWGITGFDKGTIIECSVATLAKENNTVTPVCFEFNAARNYDLDPAWVGKQAAKMLSRSCQTMTQEEEERKI